MKKSGGVKSIEKIENDRKDPSFSWPSGKIKKIILLLKGVERVTKALPGVSWYKIAPLLS